MSRLTKKDVRYVEGDKRFLSPYCIVECGLQAEIDRLTKLGQLEDIMEKYEINSLQGLEAILKDYDDMAKDVVEMALGVKVEV